MFLIFLHAILGLIFGSFVSMASYRLQNSRSMWPRSECVMCHTKLKPIDLIPLLSYIISHGKCRYCSEDISSRYPLIELMTATLFVGIILCVPFGVNSVLMCILAVLLAIIIVTDLESYIIPDICLVFMTIIAAVYGIWNHHPLIHALVIAAISFFVGLCLFYGSRLALKRDGLGFGDVKFFAVAGFFLDVDSIAWFFMLSGLFGIFLGILWQMLKLGREFPFGPALALSLYILLLVGNT